MADKFSDVITYVLSLTLAAGVIAFAAYKVTVLNGMDNPPANMGLNFPAPRRKVIMDGLPGADPITTQSLPPTMEQPSPRETQGGLQAYSLLTVVDGVAFVAVDTDAGKTLVPVTVGSTLPGGLTISAIRRQEGRWRLVAGNLTLEQSPPPAQ